jgi:hypothetical protein
MSEVRLERLLGRRVLARNGRAVGRIEEVRAERRGAGCVVVEYVLGPAGLFERLAVNVGGLWGAQRDGLVAGWDQVDITQSPPRLRCAVTELRRGSRSGG